MRPPSPCHLKVLRDGSGVQIQWTRRSHRGWTWADGVGVADDPFPELYQLTITGPGGQITVDCPTAGVSLAAGQLPAEPSQPITLSVAMAGPMALSRESSVTIIV